jgi:pyridoxine 5-phosphate synthase
MKLGINIDHIAVLREARRVNSPNLIDALPICDIAGAEQITIHLREDRRHIQDKDVKDIIEHSILPINLECAIEPSIIDIVCSLKPHRATLVPEKREEVTTEGGLAVSLENTRLLNAIKKLQENEIEVSLFIDPTIEATRISSELGVEWVEYHTGKFANIWAMLYSNLAKSNHSIKELELDRTTLKSMLKSELNTLKEVSILAKELGLMVAAGHGLNYHNVKEIVKIKQIQELNIGQSIIARSIFTGLERAIIDMKELMKIKS